MVAKKTYACDENVLIGGAKFHAKDFGGAFEAPVRRLCAQFLAARNRTRILVPAVFLYRVFLGCKSQRELELIGGYLRGVETVAISASAARLGHLLRLELGRGAAHRKDCRGYAAASLAGADALVSRDRDFVGAGNRVRVPEAARVVGLRPIPCMTPEEAVRTTKTNPKKVLSPWLRKDPAIEAHLKRADKVLRAFCGDDEDAQEAFGCGFLKAMGVRFYKPRSKAKSRPHA